MTPRIGVSTEGGSGPYYAMKWVQAGGRGNRTTTDIDATLLVDRKASLFLIGTVMDYEVNELSAGFTFINPNQKGRCGCGESFHL